MNKKLLSLIMAFVMIFGTISIVSAETGNKKVDWLLEKGYVVGDGGTGDLRLKDSIAREEVATIVVKAIGKDNLVDTFKALPSVFTDMNTSTWSNGYVNVANNEGIINGFPDKTFGPKKNITYQEVIVMLVLANGKLTEKENNSLPWPGPYIAKALELGIVDSTLGITDYKATATREKVFEMLYNAVYKKEDVKYENYKVIVTETPRVKNLGKDELGIVVLDNQLSNTKRYDKGVYTRIKYENSLSNIENLLGKVLDVSIDKDNNIKKISIDNSFNYLSGQIEAKDGNIKLDNKNYNVFVENKYENVIDEIQGLYINDKSYNYKDDYKKLTNDFSRVTIKGGSVYFIEAFDFSDISPVKKVDNGEIYIINDALLANERKVNLKQVMSYTEKEGLKSIKPNEIKELDILHIYEEDKAIVKQQSSMNGKFDKVLEGPNNDILVEISGNKYKLNNNSSKKPVYSLDGTSFITLEPNMASKVLAVLRNEEVKFGLDLVSELQYIKADINFTERVGLIDEVLNKAIKVTDSNKKQVILNEQLDTIYNLAGFNQKHNLGIFSRGDLVYISNDGDYIEKMSRLATANEILAKSKPVKKNPSGKFDITREYSVTKDTHVFIMDIVGNKVTSLEPSSIDYVMENVDVNSDLHAYVITDKQFDNYKLGNKIITSGRVDVANTIIFTKFKSSGGKLNEQVFKAKYRFVNGRDEEVEGTDPDGKVIVRKVDKYADMPTIEDGDIVLLYITNTSDMIVKSAVIKIAEKDPWFEVVSLDVIEGKISNLTIRNEKGDRKEYRVGKGVLEMGTAQEGSKVKISFDKSGDVDIILVK